MSNFTNTCYGTSALSNVHSDTDASFNTAIGSYASLNTVGNNNTSLGGNALLENTSGNYNVAVGTDALCFNTTGSSNVAM